MDKADLKKSIQTFTQIILEISTIFVNSKTSDLYNLIGQMVLQGGEKGIALSYLSIDYMDEYPKVIQKKLIENIRNKMD